MPINSQRDPINPITMQEFRLMLQEFIDKTDKPDAYASLLILTAQVKQITETLEKISNNIYGNDKPGLISLVRSHHDRLNAYDKFMWLVGGIIASLVIGSIYYLILTHGTL